MPELIPRQVIFLRRRGGNILFKSWVYRIPVCRKADMLFLSSCCTIRYLIQPAPLWRSPSPQSGLILAPPSFLPLISTLLIASFVVVCACRGVKCLLLARLLLSDVVTQNRAGGDRCRRGRTCSSGGSWPWSCLVPPSFVPLTEFPPNFRAAILQ